jgi:hypothetical protein
LLSNEAVAERRRRRIESGHESQALIAAHAELRERELIKMTKLAAALLASLRERGVPQATAALLAQTGTTLFHNAFERWIEDSKKRDLAHHLQEALTELRLLTARRGPAGAAARLLRRAQRSCPTDDVAIPIRRASALRAVRLEK